MDYILRLAIYLYFKSQDLPDSMILFIIFTWIWFGTTRVHLDMSLCWNSQNVPLHIDVVLREINPNLGLFVREGAI